VRAPGAISQSTLPIRSLPLLPFITSFAADAELAAELGEGGGVVASSGAKLRALFR
jgi:hypothetical protein